MSEFREITMPASIETRVVWDLPTRLFHWLFAAGFFTAAFIALVLDEEGPVFSYHAIIGLVITGMACLRIVWGFIGSRYARFSAFAFAPSEVARYVSATMRGGGKRYVGHNPGSAYAIFAMILLLLGLAATGIMLGSGVDSVKEIHELLTYCMIGVVVVHIAGVIFHSLRHRENITAGMIHGKKAAEPAEGIRSAHPLLALAFLALSGGWTAELLRGYDPASQSLVVPILGKTLQIGEANESDGSAAGQRRHDEHADD